LGLQGPLTTILGRDMEAIIPTVFDKSWIGKEAKGHGASLPSYLKHLWTFKEGINSKKGPDLSFLYPTGTLPDFAGGVRASTIPPIDPEKGWFGGPGYTNKCTCNKANPTDTTNITKNGDAASVLSVVNDSAALAAGVASGLHELGACAGNVYKLDNSAGSTVAWVTVSGTTGNTNPHTVSAYVRGSGSCRVILAAGTPNVSALTANYVLKSDLNKIPINATVTLLISAEVGSITYFILPQLVESPYLLPTISDSNAAAISVVSSASGATYYAGWPMDYNTKAGQEMLECLRGVPDWVEYWVNPTLEAGWTNLGGGSYRLQTATFGRVFVSNNALQNSRILVGFKLDAMPTGIGRVMSSAGTIKVFSAQDVGKYHLIEATFTTENGVYFRESTAPIDMTISDISIQKLNPAVFTLMDQTYMGVGSGELPAGATTDIALLSEKNNGTNGIYAGKSSAGEQRINRSTDGTTTIIQVDSWDYTNIIRRVLQTNPTDVNQFRIGYQRLTAALVPIDANFVYRAWATFDGSMNPLAALKMFYSATTPNYKQLVALSNKSLSDAEIAKVFNYAK